MQVLNPVNFRHKYMYSSIHSYMFFSLAITIFKIKDALSCPSTLFIDNHTFINRVYSIIDDHVSLINRYGVHTWALSKIDR